MSTESFTRDQECVADDRAVFGGAQVPVRELYEYMRGDWNLYGFLRKFPRVTMAQALGELERCARQTAQRIIRSDAEIAGGALVFEGTDVVVERMFEYLAGVKSLKDFHWDFPSVCRVDAYAAVVTAGRILELDAYRGVDNGVVHCDRRIVSGAPVFVGSRMPIRIVFDYLSEGKTLKDFYYDYDTGIKERLVPAVKLAWQSLAREFYAGAAG